MKICYVLAHFYPHVGGGEKAMLDYILSVHDKNVEVRVVTCSENGLLGHQKYQNIDIYYYDWKILFGHPIVKSKDIEEHIKWSDIVHTAVYSPVITTSKICKKLHKPLVVTVFEALNNKWFWIEKNKIKALMFKTYESLVLKSWCSCYHSISNATTIDLKKHNVKKPIHQIYCIVDQNEKHITSNRKKIDNFFNTNSEDIIFLSYGRPGKTKGIFVYLEAIKKTINSLNKKQLKNIKFCFIMGNDPISEKNRFLKLVKENHLEHNVIVKDSVPREDLDIYIKSCDYVVVPSITEGFGLTAIEACDMHKKLIYSNAGSLPEVTFGETLEFENRNSEDLSNKLNKIILKQISFNKKEKKDFSSKTIRQQLLNMYKTLKK